MSLTWTETRMYLMDENWLSSRPKMENHIFRKNFVWKTAEREQALAETIIRRLTGE